MVASFACNPRPVRVPAAGSATSPPWGGEYRPIYEGIENPGSPKAVSQEDHIQQELVDWRPYAINVFTVHLQAHDPMAFDKAVLMIPAARGLRDERPDVNTLVAAVAGRAWVCVCASARWRALCQERRG